MDRGLDIEVDGSGNVYVTGFFSGTSNFGGSSLTAAGGQGRFLWQNIRLLVWLIGFFSAGGTGAEQGNGIAVDGSGNVIVTGQFEGSATFGTTVLNSAVNTASATNSIDVFTLKLSAMGAFSWVEQGSGEETDRGMDISVDASGNIYIIGQFSNNITFDATHNNLIANAIFVVKYNASGTEQWFRKIAASVSIGYGVSVTGKQCILLREDFQGTLIFYGNPNNFLSSTFTNNIFVGQYNLSGDYINAVAQGSENQLSSRDIATDAAGSCYLVGNFTCSFDEMNQTHGASTFLSVGYQDIFVSKFNSSLVWQWARTNLVALKMTEPAELISIPLMNRLFVEPITIP